MNNAPNAIIEKIDITSAIEIHIGERTHHQDQVITSHNFKTIKVIVRSTAKLIPPLEFIDCFDILFSLKEEWWSEYYELRSIFVSIANFLHVSQEHGISLYGAVLLFPFPNLLSR